MAGFLRSNSLISSAIFRVSARSHAPAARPSAVFTRFFATAHEHDDAEEMQKWRNISIAAIIACTALAIYNFSGEQHHEASEHPIEYSYLHIRNKEFPWGPNGLFEYKEHWRVADLWHPYPSALDALEWISSCFGALSVLKDSALDRFMNKSSELWQFNGFAKTLWISKFHMQLFH
jgi:cytochrome c oxidase subunit 6a